MVVDMRKTAAKVLVLVGGVTRVTPGFLIEHLDASRQIWFIGDTLWCEAWRAVTAAALHADILRWQDTPSP